MRLEKNTHTEKKKNKKTHKLQVGSVARAFSKDVWGPVFKEKRGKGGEEKEKEESRQYDKWLLWLILTKSIFYVWKEEWRGSDDAFFSLLVDLRFTEDKGSMWNVQLFGKKRNVAFAWLRAQAEPSLCHSEFGF